VKRRSNAPGAWGRRVIRPDQRVLIYALSDAGTPDVVRYVGQTAYPMDRFRAHVAATGTRYWKIDTPVRQWLASERPHVFMSCLEFCPAKCGDDRELHWMVEFRRAGMADLNVMSRAVCLAFDVPYLRDNHPYHKRPRRRRAA
jgi:hypothetical protein